MLKLKHKLVLLTFSLVLGLLPVAVFLPARVSAAPIPAGCPGSTLQGPPGPGVCEAIPAGCPGTTLQGPQAPNAQCPYEAPEAGTPQAEQTFANPPSSSNNVTDTADCKVDPSKEELNSGNCNIVKWISTAVNVLSVMVGIVVTIMIIVGGIRYTAAGAEPNAVAAAKKQIFNAIFALVAYGLTYALLQYLIPGGFL